MRRAARGETVSNFEGKLLFDDGLSRDFFGGARPLYNSDGMVRGAVGAFVDMTERKKTEKRAALLALEVDHRAKNIMAVVQALVRRTNAEDINAFRKAVSERIANLARTHSLLAANRWDGVWLTDLVRAEFAAYKSTNEESAATDHVSMSGPDVRLQPALVQSLSVVIHELVTNAAKYGALSVPQGNVCLAWRVEENDNVRVLHIEWTEENGPPVIPPETTGFGSEVIAGMIEHQLGGTLQKEWRPSGLFIKIAVPLR
jgi:two-component sensor histidine kinase